MDLRERIETSGMSHYQWLIVGVATFLNALDGYDVLAISFTATSVTADFDLSGTGLGLVMSAALIGMAVGALTLGPIADRIGRRPMIVLALIINASGLFLSATAQTATELGIWRLVTGLGIGGILVGTNVITAEFSSRHRRGLAISIYAAGFGLGGALGGTTMIALIDAFGWRSVYLFGGIMSVISLIVVLALLPESPQYLYQRQPRNTQRRLEIIAKRLGQTGKIELPECERPLVPQKRSRPELTRLISPEYRRVTFVIWISFFTVMFGFYFANSWTPTLMHDSGLSETLSMFVGVMLTLGGAIGCVIFGMFTGRWSTRLTLTWFTLLAGALMALFVFATPWAAIVLLVGILVGFFANGCIAGLYTLTPQSYPARLRSTGVGLAIGIGRLGAIIAPTVTGALTDAGWTPEDVYMTVGLVLLIATAALISMRGLNIEANRSPREDLAARQG